MTSLERIISAEKSSDAWELHIISIRVPVYNTVYHSLTQQLVFSPCNSTLRAGLPKKEAKLCTRITELCNSQSNQVSPQTPLSSRKPRCSSASQTPVLERSKSRRNRRLSCWALGGLTTDWESRRHRTVVDEKGQVAGYAPELADFTAWSDETSKGDAWLEVQVGEHYSVRMYGV